ncbi:hypothetical protein Tco_1084634 [Tanacetum coccineum]
MKRISKGYYGVDILLFPTMLTAPESSPSRITSSPFLSPQTHPSTSQQPPILPFMQTIHYEEEPVTLPYESPLHSVHSLGRDKGSVSLNELTDLCTSLSKKVGALENKLQQTKKTYSTAITKLIFRAKKLEKQVKTSKARRREDAEIQEKISDDTEVLLEEEERNKIVEDQGSGQKGEKEVSTIRAEHSTVIPEVSTANIVVTTAENLVYIRRSAEKKKDKGKGMKRKESTKRQKIEDDVGKEELKAYLDLVPREEFAMEIESLATKADGSSKNYKIFSEMLDDFDRQDVLDLHMLVKARYMTSSPEGYDLMLWGDLKILFEPDEEGKVWRNQHEYNLISWRLFDSRGIHILLMNNGITIHMMNEKFSTYSRKCIKRC